jgi:RNA polymerase sigma factor (sigma-70 family)
MLTAELSPHSPPTHVQSLLLEDFTFMNSAVFRRKHIEKELFGFGSEPKLPPSSWYRPTGGHASDRALATPPLLKSAEERLMFYRFNYCKLRLARLQRAFNADAMPVESAAEFLQWHRKFEHFREFLVRTNLALVLAMAKRSRMGDVDFAEVVSEGNMALLRALDKFDVDRGFKFSTYACRAILKAFSRTAKKASRHRSRFPVEFDPGMERSDWHSRRHDATEADCIDELKAIVDRNLADLSLIEQSVIHRRFNWKHADEAPLTLQEMGRIIGVTKERVRQIQNKALAKIRTVMEAGVLRVRPWPSLTE